METRPSTKELTLALLASLGALMIGVVAVSEADLKIKEKLEDELD